MKEAKHTPGPWTFSVQEQLGEVRFYVAQAEGAPFTPSYSDVSTLIAQTVSGERVRTQEANARLIAAAPENLQSNSELATIVRELCAAYEHPLPEDALARSDAAIAKATGCEDSGQGSQKGTP